MDHEERGPFWQDRASIEGKALQTVKVTSIVDENASAAEAAYTIGGRTYSSTGSAKREPGDRRFPKVGRMLSTARALRNLADVIEADAEVFVRANCDRPHVSPPALDFDRALEDVGTFLSNTTEALKRWARRERNI